MIRTLSPTPSALLVALSLCSAGSLGCQTQSRPGEIRVSSLPLYDSKAQALFGDTFEPAALGVSLDNPSFKGDPIFRERVQTADVIANVTITTVTIGKTDERTTYQLSFAVSGEPLNKQRPTPEELELSVPEGSMAFPLLNLVQTRARGRSMLGLWKRYRVGDELASHWYFAPDDPETTAAVKEALTLQELSKP